MMTPDDVFIGYGQRITYGTEDPCTSERTMLYLTPRTGKITGYTFAELMDSVDQISPEVPHPLTESDVMTDEQNPAAPVFGDEFFKTYRDVITEALATGKAEITAGGTTVTVDWGNPAPVTAAAWQEAMPGLMDWDGRVKMSLARRHLDADPVADNPRPATAVEQWRDVLGNPAPGPVEKEIRTALAHALAALGVPADAPEDWDHIRNIADDLRDRLGNIAHELRKSSPTFHGTISQRVYPGEYGGAGAFTLTVNGDNIAALSALPGAAQVTFTEGHH